MILSEILMASSTVFTGLMDWIRMLLLPIIILVVTIFAVMRAVKGRFMEMIILIGVALVALIFFINPDILQSLATNLSGEVKSNL